MEDDIRKKRVLFLQQQRFVKKWRRVWCVLFRESVCSVSRLELFDCKDGAERSDRTLKKHQENKKVIRLSTCIRVSAVDVEACPKDTAAFLIETTEKIFVFAADRLQVDDWTHRLCEIAFPMNWSDPGLKRGSSQRGTGPEPDQEQDHSQSQQMEDNSLYSQRESVGFRVGIRRTEASERCRLKGEAVLQADADALILLDRTGQVLFAWPYRYLRRFGRDKSTFSFEAGRRCDSGEGSFEFETKLGNAVFVAVETAINLQRRSLPQRQTSTGLDTHLPITRSLPPRPEDPEGVYSLVNDSSLQASHKESSSPSQRHHLNRLAPPVDKTLTAVKSLTLENREPPVLRKNQVKMISSCPLPCDSAPSATGHAPKTAGQTYSQVGPERKKKPKATHDANGTFEVGHSFESEYSLPFDRLTPDLVTAEVVTPGLGDLGERGGVGTEAQRPDPLYDSIDEFQVRGMFFSNKPEHIYDEPEGCHLKGLGAGDKMASVGAAASLYDEPEEMRGEAWRIMGTEQDPRGHEFPYNPRADDYAVPKRAQRAFLEPPFPEPPCPDDEELHQSLSRSLSQDLDLSLDPEQEQGPGTEDRDSPYRNVMLKNEQKH